MKVLCATVYLFLFSASAFSQDYIEIYRTGIRGVVTMEKNPAEAERCFRKVYELMPDKTEFPYYFQLIKIANNDGDNKKIASSLRELSCIYTKDTILTYLKESEIPIDSIAFDKLYEPKCSLTKNKSYSGRQTEVTDSIIKSIIGRDQAVRNKANHNRENRTEAEMQALEKEFHEVDSANFVVLYDCIKKYGFPHLNYPRNISRVTLLMHIDNYDHFKMIDGWLLKAIKEGHLHPIEYAFAMERSLVASGKKPKYYWFTPKSSFYEKYKPVESEIKKVNEERDLIGLPPYPAWTGTAY